MQDENPATATAQRVKVLAKGEGEVEIQTGQQARQPIWLQLPQNLSTGNYVLSAEFRFSTGERQTDQFTIHILTKPNSRELSEIARRRKIKIGLFDPHGEMLNSLTEFKFPINSFQQKPMFGSLMCLSSGRER